jgi:hypothetical protein
MSASRRSRKLLTATALSVVALLALAPLSAGERTSSSDGPSAGVSRTTSLNETGHLHLTSKHNFTLNERGTATGTVTGTIYVHLTAVSSTRVTAEVNIYARGASFSGNGNASYHRGSTTASFAGSMSINRGTGGYAHVHGSGLSFSGTIAESRNDAIAMRVSGRVSA